MKRTSVCASPHLASMMLNASIYSKITFACARVELMESNVKQLRIVVLEILVCMVAVVKTMDQG